MAGLEDRVKELEGKIERLLGGLRLGPQQAGPMPGWFRASRIEGNQMLINMVDSKAGVAPRISVTDTNNVTRAEMGNLASYTGPNGTNSPAMYGFRANDATGNAIFDSLGLIQTMTVLINGGTQTGGPIVGVAGPPTGLSGVGGEITLVTGSFTLTRPGNVILLAVCTNYVLSVGPLVTAHPIYFQLDGSDDSMAYGYAPVWASPGTAETRALTTTLLKVSALATGSHTVNVIWNSEEGANAQIFNANNALFAFQLGF